MKLRLGFAFSLQLLAFSLSAATGSWNGASLTAWNGIAQTAWNGTAISCASYTYTATKFDSADVLTHTGDLTGSANSKLLTLSFWFKLSNAAENGVERVLFKTCGGIIDMTIEDGTRSGSSVANDMHFVAQDSNFSPALRFVTATTFTSSATWHHFALSVDLANSAKRFIYIDGALDSTSWINFADLAMYVVCNGDQLLMASTGGASPTTGSLAEVWIGFGQYLDISVAGNLQKFRSAGGAPVNLGADGSTPTGNQPTIYLKNSFSTFHNNLGSGGNFTVAGTLQDDPAKP